MFVQVGFPSCEILRYGIVPPNTLKKILGGFYSTQNSSTITFYYMFSLKLHQGGPAHVLVPLPFLVRPVSAHIKLKKCLM
jgi:hypothetical protein